MMSFWSRKDPVREEPDANKAVLSAALRIEQASARGDLVGRLVTELNKEREMNNFVERLNMHVRRGRTE